MPILREQANAISNALQYGATSTLHRIPAEHQSKISVELTFGRHRAWSSVTKQGHHVVCFDPLAREAHFEWLAQQLGSCHRQYRYAQYTVPKHRVVRYLDHEQGCIERRGIGSVDDLFGNTRLLLSAERPVSEPQAKKTEYDVQVYTLHPSVAELHLAQAGHKRKIFMTIQAQAWLQLDEKAQQEVCDHILEWSGAILTPNETLSHAIFQNKLMPHVSFMPAFLQKEQMITKVVKQYAMTVMNEHLTSASLVLDMMCTYLLLSNGSIIPVFYGVLSGMSRLQDVDAAMERIVLKVDLDMDRGVCFVEDVLWDGPTQMHTKTLPIRVSFCNTLCDEFRTCARGSLLGMEMKPYRFQCTEEAVESIREQTSDEQTILFVSNGNLYQDVQYISRPLTANTFTLDVDIVVFRKHRRVQCFLHGTREDFCKMMQKHRVGYGSIEQWSHFIQHTIPPQATCDVVPILCRLDHGEIVPASYSEKACPFATPEVIQTIFALTTTMERELDTEVYVNESMGSDLLLHWIRESRSIQTNEQCVSTESAFKTYMENAYSNQNVLLICGENALEEEIGRIFPSWVTVRWTQDRRSTSHASIYYDHDWNTHHTVEVLMLMYNQPVSDEECKEHWAQVERRSKSFPNARLVVIAPTHDVQRFEHVGETRKRFASIEKSGYTFLSFSAPVLQKLEVQPSPSTMDVLSELVQSFEDKTAQLIEANVHLTG